MGIKVEFNLDLALREYGTGGRLETECLPKDLKEGEEYEFLKTGQRNFWLEGACPLRTTGGNQKLSRPIAAVQIVNYTHSLKDGKPHTSGIYRVIQIFDINDPQVHFEGYTIL